MCINKVIQRLFSQKDCSTVGRALGRDTFQCFPTTNNLVTSSINRSIYMEYRSLLFQNTRQSLFTRVNWAKVKVLNTSETFSELPAI